MKINKVFIYNHSNFLVFSFTLFDLFIFINLSFHFILSIHFPALICILCYLFISLSSLVNLVLKALLYFVLSSFINPLFYLPVFPPVSSVFPNAPVILSWVTNGYDLVFLNLSVIKVGSYDVYIIVYVGLYVEYTIGTFSPSIVLNTGSLDKYCFWYV